MSYQFTHAAETNGQAQESDRFDHLRGTVRRSAEVVAGKGRVDRPRGCGLLGSDRSNSLSLGNRLFISKAWTASTDCGSLESQERSNSFSRKIKISQVFCETLLTAFRKFVSIRTCCTWRSELAEFTQRIFPVLALPRATT